MGNKIMYVEDDIGVVIAHFDRFFASILSDGERNKIDEIRRRGFRINFEQIKTIIKDNIFLEIFDNFEEALRHICSDSFNHEDYNMFIFDRNLAFSSKDVNSENIQYDSNKICQLSDACNVCFYKSKYKRQEGDFLATILHMQGCNIKEKVFFHSAYTEDDSPLAGYMSAWFSLDNFYEKKHSLNGRDSNALAKLIHAKYKWQEECSDVLRFLVKSELNDVYKNLKEILILDDITCLQEVHMNARHAVAHILNYIWKHHYNLLATSYKSQTYINTKSEEFTKSSYDIISRRIGKLHTEHIEKKKRKKSNYSERNNGSIVPDIIHSHFESVNKIINSVAHDGEICKINECSSAYTHNAIVNALLDIILWLSKQKMQSPLDLASTTQANDARLKDEPSKPLKLDQASATQANDVPPPKREKDNKPQNHMT